MKQERKTARFASRQTLKFYWQAVWNQKRYTLPLMLVNTPSHIVSEVIQPVAISEIIASLTHNPVQTSRAIHYFYIWLAASIVFFILLRLVFYLYNRMQLRVQRELDRMCLDKFSQLEPSFFANQFTGALVTRVSKFNAGFERVSDAITAEMDTLVVQMIATIFIIGSRSILLALIVIVAGAAIGFATILVGKYRIPLIRRGSMADSRVSGFFADFLTNILSVKSFSQLRAEHKNYETVADDRYKKRIESRNMGEKIRIVRSVIVDSFQLLILLALIYLATHGKIDVATIVLMQIYLFKIVESLWSINNIATTVQESLGNAGEMTEILMQPVQLKDPQHPKKLSTKNGDIVLKDVTFAYHEGAIHQDLFNDFSLSIKSGEKIGLVGPSGGGKTTLTKLLLRFMDISGGSITIDGQNISQLAQDDLRSVIAYVPQEPLLFHRSIKENIAYGDPGASDAEIKEVAKLAHAEEFISKLPQGFDTLVGERGVKLSGGEKQRIAIARAMLKKAPILILDEATSALDSKSEKAIVAALDNLMKGRTTIVIAHRLSTIRKMDRIVVLKDGQVVEDGSHQKLLQNKSVYAELWQHQSGQFLEEQV